MRPDQAVPEVSFLARQRRAIVRYAGATVNLEADDAGVVHATVEQVATVKDGPRGDDLKGGRDRVPDAEWNEMAEARAGALEAADQIRDTLDRQLPHTPDEVPSREQLVRLAAAEVARITAQQEATP